MNLGKAEVKIDVANELGCRLDDLLEANQKELLRLEGSVRAFQSMGHAVEGLMKVVDQEMDEGRFDLEAAAHIKRYVQRAHQMSLNLALQAENTRIMQLGRIQASEQAVKITKKFKDEELSKVTALQKALEENRVREGNGALEHVEGPRPVAIRPGATIKERRLAEEAATKAPPEAVSAEPAELVLEPTEASPQPEVAPEPPPQEPPKKGRRKVARA